MMRLTTTRARARTWRALAALVLAMAADARVSLQTTGLREFPNRQEGTTVRPNNLPDLDLLALHRQFRTFGPAASLHVRFFVPADAASGVLCEARELNNFKHYYMRARGTYPWKPGQWNVFEPWPTADVIDGLAIPSSNLGVLASYALQDGTRVYAPVDVYTGDAPDARDTYTVFFAAGRDIQTLTTFVRDASGRTVVPAARLSCSRSANPDCRLFSNDTTQPVDISFRALPTGLYRVGLEATVPRTTQTMALSVPVYHAR